LTSPSGPASSSPTRVLAVLLISFGIALRLIAVFQRDGLVGEELTLTLNVVGRSYTGLLQPLSYAQTAPIPFLWAERLAVQLNGVDQAALRVLPFVSGCLTLVVLWAVASRLLSEADALLALGLAATSPVLIDSSAEVTPYALDALMCMLVVASALSVLRDVTNRIAWAGLAGLGTIALVASLPAAFVLAAVIAALAWRLRTSTLPVVTLRLLATAMVWVDVFVLMYQVAYRQIAADPYMLRYWGAAMLTPGPRFMTRWAAGVEEALWPVSYWMVWLGLAAVLGLACVAGAVFIRRRHGASAALLLLGPLAALLGASALGRYPLAIRLTIFTAPLLTLAAAGGIGEGARWLNRRIPSVRAEWLQFVVLVPSIMLGFAWAIEAPGSTQGMPAIVQQIEQRRLPGEPVYIFHRAIPSWAFYSTDWLGPDPARLSWIARIASPQGPSFANAPPRGARQIGEGDSLMYRYRQREELFGTASGVQNRAWLPPEPDQRPDWQAKADPGWALAEAARLHTMGRRIWAVFTGDSPGHEVLDLLRAIERIGGRIESRLEVAGTSLYSIRFGPDSSSS
jgi:Dolichyl-phosphate-mannose-protein mannosyltransferase